MSSQTGREAWIRIRREDEIPADAPNNYNFGFRAAMGRLQATHPTIGRAFSALYRQIMFERGHLSRQEREMVAAVTAAAQDCYYWTQSHAEFLRVEDGDAAVIDAIKQRRWREVESLSPRERALCTLAEKLSATPTRMVEADWQPLRDLGFDDQACLEVAHIVGIFNYLTRMADGFGLQLDAATQAASESGVALQRVSPTTAGG